MVLIEVDQTVKGVYPNNPVGWDGDRLRKSQLGVTVSLFLCFPFFLVAELSRCDRDPIPIDALTSLRNFMYQLSRDEAEGAEQDALEKHRPQEPVALDYTFSICSKEQFVL